MLAKYYTQRVWRRDVGGMLLRMLWRKRVAGCPDCLLLARWDTVEERVVGGDGEVCC